MSSEELHSLLEEKQRRDAILYQSVWHDRYMSKNDDGTDRWPAENAPFHYEVYDLLDDPDEDHLNLIFPREHAKTMKFNEEFVVKTLITKPGSYVVILRESETDAEENVKAIRAEIEDNTYIAADYGDMVGKTWTDLDILLANGSRLRGAGKRASLRGTKTKDQRPTLVLMDDMQKLENLDSALNRDRDWRWVLTTVMPIGTVGTKYIITGNKIHRDSIIARAEKNAAWNTVIYNAWLDKKRTKPLWPEFWPVKRLEAKEVELGRSEFEREFQNNPRDSEDAVFDEKWFVFEDPPCHLRDMERIYAYADPAQGKKNSDISALVVLGIYEGIIYVLDAWMEQKGVIALIKAGYEFAKKYDLNLIGVESNIYGELLDERLKLERIERGSTLPWKTYIASKNKQIRIAKLEAPIQAGTMKFAKHLKDSVLHQQFLDYHAKLDDEDDGPDASSGAFSMFPKTGLGSPRILGEDSRIANPVAIRVGE